MLPLSIPFIRFRLKEKWTNANLIESFPNISNGRGVKDNFNITVQEVEAYIFASGTQIDFYFLNSFFLFHFLSPKFFSPYNVSAIISQVTDVILVHKVIKYIEIIKAI